MSTSARPLGRSSRRLLRKASEVMRSRNPLKSMAATALWRSGLSRWLLIRCPGFRLRFHPSAMSAAYWLRPAGGPDEAFLRAYLGPGDRVVDVGANIGALSFAAALAVGATGRVLALEPHPRTYAYLEHNAGLNRLGQLETRNLALGSRPGRLHLSDEVGDEFNAIDPAGPVEVQVETLDRLLVPGWERIDLLKVDVEGYELEVFRGGAAALARTGCIYFESWEPHCRRYGHSSRDVLARLAASGFALGRLEGLEPVAIGPDRVSETCQNLVAVRDWKAFAARLRAGQEGRA